MPLINVPTMLGSVSNAASRSNPLSLKLKVLNQSAAQIAGTENHGAVSSRHPQDLSNFVAKIGDRITVTLLAKFAKTAEILANLRCGNTHVITQCRGRDTNVAFFI